MSQVFEISLVASPQQFTVTLGNKVYRMRLIWCDPAQAWTLDIADSAGTPVLQGIQLVTGLDLLSQFGYLQFGGQLIVQTDNNVDAVPTFTNLGTSSHLYFITS